MRFKVQRVWDEGGKFGQILCLWVVLENYQITFYSQI